eukprot:gene27032-35483_t
MYSICDCTCDCPRFAASKSDLQVHFTAIIPFRYLESCEYGIVFYVPLTRRLILVVAARNSDSNKQWILGGIGQSCDSACEVYNNLVCSPEAPGAKYGWPITKIDFTKIMKITETSGAFSCTAIYYDDPAASPFYPSTDGKKCIFNTAARQVSTCSASHFRMRRFCPCGGHTNTFSPVDPGRPATSTARSLSQVLGQSTDPRSNAGITFQVYRGKYCYGDGQYTLPGSYNDNIWRHVAWTLSLEVNGYSIWTIYMNGMVVQQLQSMQYTNTMVRSYNYLGKSNWDGNPYFSGAISDFRLYSRVLSATEIASLYAGIPTATPTMPLTALPTTIPSARPSQIPTAIPSFPPTTSPTVAPWPIPTALPSFPPTFYPT